jgi:hypothetical protein
MARSGEGGELKIFTPIGMIGYGFSEEILWKTLADGVDAIIADCGSTDSGPQKLALGTTTVSRQAYERDLDLLLAACHIYHVPILLGSAGCDGANDHVDLFVEIMKQLITAKKYRSMKIVSIYSEINKDFIKSRLKSGEIIPCGKAVPPLKPSDIDQSTRVVAQMGLEPFLKAMRDHPDFDIIVGGRAYDPAPYAAICVYHGFTDLGIAYHMGKIMECGASCAIPKSQSALATVREDSFDIVPLDPASRCTVTSVAAHTLYEKTRPDILLGPGGSLNLNMASYQQLEDNRTVRVSGGKFVVADRYTVKLEGARVVGYGSVFFGGFRDPILISQMDQFLHGVKAYVKSKTPYDYDLEIHQYGRNAIMGQREPDGDLPKEIGICGQIRAPTQEQALYICNIARLACIHGPYPYQLATAGNFAMSFPPFDIPMGQGCEFCIYHLLQVTDPLSLFPITHRILEGEGIFTRITITAAETEAAAVNSEKDRILAAFRPVGLKDRPFLRPEPPDGFCYLGDIASVIRTKNAGPYELTMDVMFNDDLIFQWVKASGVLCADVILEVYKIPKDDLIACLFWDPARAFKATIKRPRVSGQFGDMDMHGSQQHIPLLYLTVPISRTWISSTLR